MSGLYEFCDLVMSVNWSVSYGYGRRSSKIEKGALERLVRTKKKITLESWDVFECFYYHQGQLIIFRELEELGFFDDNGEIS